jgi:hypothetical protein
MTPTDPSTGPQQDPNTTRPGGNTRGQDGGRYLDMGPVRVSISGEVCDRQLNKNNRMNPETKQGKTP